MLFVARVVVFSFAFIFACIVLGLAADFTHTTQNVLNITYNFAALAISIASITVVSLPILLVADCIWDNAFTSWVLFELLWIFVLWALWVATSADTAHFNSIDLFSSCNIVRPFLRRGCREVQSVEGFSFIIWIILFCYWIALLICVIIGMGKRRITLKSTVRLGNFFGDEVDHPPVAQATTNGASQPSMQQTSVQAPAPQKAQGQAPDSIV